MLEHKAIFVTEHRQVLKCRRILHDKRTFLDDLRVLRELVHPRALSGIGHELLMREARERVHKLHIQVLF